MIFSSRSLEANDLEWIRCSLLTLILAGTGPSSPCTLHNGGSGVITWSGQGYGRPLDAPETGAKRPDAACRPVRMFLPITRLPFRPSGSIAEPLVEPIESRAQILGTAPHQPAQSPEEVSSLDWLCGIIIICLTAGASGETLKYLALIVTLVPWLACCTGPTAGSWAVRDQLIGWSRAQRETNLCYVVNNQRFLILPW